MSHELSEELRRIAADRVPEKDLIRFSRYIRPSDSGCWEWTGGKTKGYGQFWYFDRVSLAHHFSLRIDGRIIPQGMECDHLCKNTACVNPAHLEVVTHQVNVHRSTAIEVRIYKSKTRTHCKRGHEFTAANIYQSPKGWRICRECKKIMTRKGKETRPHARNA